MDDENKISYYAIIPATIRYDPNLKAAEKLLYGEVTALSNRNGYCFAKNKYFAELYDVTNGTVSKWFSHLQKLGYINIELIRNEKKAIIERGIPFEVNQKPSKELKEALKEADYMEKHPDKYKSYNNVDKMMKDILDEDWY